MVILSVYRIVPLRVYRLAGESRSFHEQALIGSYTTKFEEPAAGTYIMEARRQPSLDLYRLSCSSLRRKCRNSYNGSFQEQDDEWP